MVEFAKVFLFSEILQFFLCYEANKMTQQNVPIVRGFALRRVQRGDKACLKHKAFAIVSTL